jgi:two-component sensor histidine kinase
MTTRAWRTGSIPTTRRMWARVAKALDPRGDGRYDVEYRVKQPDGSWRWLSAWGLVDRGPRRDAQAPRGFRRKPRPDGAEVGGRSAAAVDQRADHRIKNTLATVQSIALNTLSGAPCPLSPTFRYRSSYPG